MNVYNFTYGANDDVKEIEVYANDEAEAKTKFSSKTGLSDFNCEMLGVCEDFDKAKLAEEYKARYKDVNYEDFVIL